MAKKKSRKKTTKANLRKKSLTREVENLKDAARTLKKLMKTVESLERTIGPMCQDIFYSVKRRKRP